jgi:carbonic anhydrase
MCCPAGQRIARNIPIGMSASSKCRRILAMVNSVWQIFEGRIYMGQFSPGQHSSRRQFLKAGVGIIGVNTLIAGLGAEALARNLADDPLPLSHLTPDAALQQLMAGNQRFVAGTRSMPHQDGAWLDIVANGQAPFATILSCADSRVVPEIAFDQGIGDLFVTRVAGNIAATAAIASTEYAVSLLGVPLCLVLGHERCGAVTAALAGGSWPGAIGSLTQAIQPAIAISQNQPGDRLTNAVKANVQMQVARLQRSPLLTAAMQTGALKIVGAYYDLDTGTVSLVD